MSGGAVINMKGELVGLTTMASSPAGFDAMAGYAIPMDRIGRRAVETLKEGKEIEYGLLGIRASSGQHQPGGGSDPQFPGRPGTVAGQRRDPGRQRHSGERLRYPDPGHQLLRPGRRGPAQDPPRREGTYQDREPGEVSGGWGYDRHESASRLAGYPGGLSEHRRPPVPPVRRSSSRCRAAWSSARFSTTRSRRGRA